MVACEVWGVKGRLDHPADYVENPEKIANPKYTGADLQAMADVIKYVTNGNKTEQQFFVMGINYDSSTVGDEMMIVKIQWNDQSEVVYHHGFQSFKTGEAMPEQAREVGVKLTEKIWGGKFRVTVVTYLGTECLYSHFIVNSISYIDGRYYHDNKKNLRLLHKHLDELCREYFSSVIEHPDDRKKPHALYQAEENGLSIRDTVTRRVVDEAVSKSFILKDLDHRLSEMRCCISFDPNCKYWTTIGKG